MKQHHQSICDHLQHLNQMRKTTYRPTIFLRSIHLAKPGRLPAAPRAGASSSAITPGHARTPHTHGGNRSASTERSAATSPRLGGGFGRKGFDISGRWVCINIVGRSRPCGFGVENRKPSKAIRQTQWFWSLPDVGSISILSISTSGRTNTPCYARAISGAVKPESTGTGTESPNLAMSTYQG